MVKQEHRWSDQAARLAWFPACQEQLQRTTITVSGMAGGNVALVVLLQGVTSSGQQACCPIVVPVGAVAMQ